MFKKILVAEDIDSISMGLSTILEKLHDAEIMYAKYCDEALLKIKRANQDGHPFDLLITDLSFKEDHRQATIPGGEELIAAVKAIQPDLKTIIYSIEERTYKIRYLLEELKADGFVWKGRESSGEVIKAISKVYNDETYLSPRFAHIFSPSALLEIETSDILLIRYLSEGLNQGEISDRFKTLGQSATSCSSIEKRINKLKIYLKAKNTAHLVSIAKDLGLV